MKAHAPQYMIVRGERVLSFLVDRSQDSQARNICDEFADGEVEVTITRYKKRRSLDSNAFAWTLIGKLAVKTGVPKTDVYRSYIREIGGNSDIVCVKNEAVDKMRSGWEGRGVGWLTETMPSKLEGCTNVILYYGSSTYDVTQMKRLTELIVADCKEYGIDTRTPEERARMLEEWNEK